MLRPPLSPRRVYGRHRDRGGVVLASLRDAAGNTTVRGLDHDARWTGVTYPPEQFRVDAHALDGVELLGSATVQDMPWSEPAVTVLASTARPSSDPPPRCRHRPAPGSALRVPPGVSAKMAQDELTAQLESVAPWHARVHVEAESYGEPFAAAIGGPAHAAMWSALELAFGRPTTTAARGGSISLCNAFRDTYPDAELMLIGVEEPRCLIHAPNESVAPSEIEHMALAEALFLSNYPTA